MALPYSLIECRHFDRFSNTTVSTALANPSSVHYLLSHRPSYPCCTSSSHSSFPTSRLAYSPAIEVGSEIGSEFRSHSSDFSLYSPSSSLSSCCPLGHSGCPGKSSMPLALASCRVSEATLSSALGGAQGKQGRGRNTYGVTLRPTDRGCASYSGASLSCGFRDGSKHLDGSSFVPRSMVSKAAVRSVDWVGWAEQESGDEVAEWQEGTSGGEGNGINVKARGEFTVLSDGLSVKGEAGGKEERTEDKEVRSILEREHSVRQEESEDVCQLSVSRRTSSRAVQKKGMEGARPMVAFTQIPSVLSPGSAKPPSLTPSLPTTAWMETASLSQSLLAARGSARIFSSSAGASVATLSARPLMRGNRIFITGPGGVLMAVALAVAGVLTMMKSHSHLHSHSRHGGATECGDCEGYGLQPCDLCGGAGNVQWEGKLYHSDPCPACFGERCKKCPSCGGVRLKKGLPPSVQELAEYM